MSLFNRALRPPPTLSDAAIERHLSALRSQIEPDPLFRRRLRSEVTNRFVAAREGTARATDASLRTSEMGRLGRACLYATFTLAAGATSVLAASEQAIPGDALYPLKLRIEEVRLEILPNHLHGELAGYALGERIEEMARLTESGRLDLAAAMAAQIDRAYDELVSLGESTGPARAARIERHLLVLDALLAKLPPTARDAVERAMSPGHDAQPGDPLPGANGWPAGGGGPAIYAPGGPHPPQSPSPTPKPERTPRPDPTQAPAPTLAPQETAKADTRGRSVPSAPPVSEADLTPSGNSSD